MTEPTNGAQSTIELEKSVLAALLTLDADEPLPPWADVIEPDMYTDPTHQQIALAIDYLRGSGGEIDLLTVADQLKGWGIGSATVAEIADAAATAAHLNYHARRLAERSQLRRLREKVAGILDEAERRPVAETRDAIAGVAATLDPLVDQSSFVPIRDVIKVVFDEAEKAVEGAPTRKIDSGLPVLDRNLHMMPADLTVIAGRPSMGKTALACTILRHASRDDGASAFFSLEMSRGAIASRLLAAEAAIDGQQLAQAIRAGKVAEAANSLHRVNMWINDRSTLTVEGMRAQLCAVPNVRLVVVDYLQLVKLPSGERHDLRVAKVVKGLKAMAKDLDCHVIALSQLSRGVENRNPPYPRLSDLRDSGAIEETADNVLLLYRPGYYSAKADDAEFEIDIAKQRNGGTPAMKLRWVAEQQTFVSW